MSISTKTAQKKAPSDKSIFKKQVNNKNSLNKQNSPVQDILNLHQTIGNEAVKRLFESGFIQGKLTVGEPNDKYEQEADRVADAVMRMLEPQVQRQSEEDEEEEMLQTKPIGEQITPLVQRQVEPEEEEEEETLQAKAEGQIPQVASNLESRINALQGGGQPLSKETRNFFEPRFGRDFSGVRVHADSNANQLARSINARAFTKRNNIVFGGGEYSPGSQGGKRLLGHELTHVVQQSKSTDNMMNKQIEREGETVTNVLQLSPDDNKIVPLTGVTVNHNRVTVPTVPGLSFLATITPPNASGVVTLSVVGDNASIAAKTTIDNSTGVITVASSQTGGSAHVKASQNATATESDGSTSVSTLWATTPFNFTAIPSGISSTSSSPGGSETMYGGDFTHTFTSPGGGQTALERSHVNELFPAASGTTLKLKGQLGKVKITVNSPNSASAGWDLDSTGQMAGPDHVTWSKKLSARPFIVNASNKTPSHTLPQELTATQNFRNLTFPKQKYGSAVVASTTHRRAFEDRENKLKAVTSANGKAVVQDYVGPTVFRRSRAIPDVIPVTVAAPREETAAAPAVRTSTISVDAEGETAKTIFSIRPPNLGCTITPGGVLTPGTTAGSVTVRAGVTANYDETNVTLIAKPSLTSFAINNDAASTGNRIVTLDNTAATPSPTHSSPTHYMASQDAGFTGASWQAYSASSASPSFTLSGGYGVKTVYLKLKNDAGESGVLNDTINFATPSLTAFTINNSAARTVNRIVTLDNTAATPSPTHYMASQDASFAGASWQTYSASPSFTLSVGYGVKTVYLKLKNDAGESGVLNDTIAYVTPPVPSRSPMPKP